MSLTSAAPTGLPATAKQAHLSDEDVARWLTQLYGNQVMDLPPELRTALYPELFTYGPAAEQIFQFLTALSQGIKNQKLLNALLELDLNTSMSRGWSGYALLRSLGNDRNLLYGLLNNLEDATDAFLTGDGRVDSSIYLIVFMLTSQIELSREDAAQFQHLVPKANRVLRICGMERLKGSFEKRYFWRGRR